MSDSLIAFQPAIEEPSNMMPSLKKSSSMVDAHAGPVCCHLPRGSVKRKSTYLTSCSLIIVQNLSWRPSGRSSLLLVDGLTSVHCPRRGSRRLIRRRVAALAGADADRLVDASRRRSCRRRCGRCGPACWIASTARLDHLVLDDHLDLHLGQEVDDVFGAAVELGMALLPAEALGLDDGDALEADLVQRFLHLVELEGLDDRLDLLHLLEPPPHADAGACRSAAARVTPQGSSCPCQTSPQWLRL